MFAACSDICTCPEQVLWGVWSKSHPKSGHKMSPNACLHWSDGVVFNHEYRAAFPATLNQRVCQLLRTRGYDDSSRWRGETEPRCIPPRLFWSVSRWSSVKSSLLMLVTCQESAECASFPCHHSRRRPCLEKKKCCVYDSQAVWSLDFRVSISKVFYCVPSCNVIEEESIFLSPSSQSQHRQVLLKSFIFTGVFQTLTHNLLVLKKHQMLTFVLVIINLQK